MQESRQTIAKLLAAFADTLNSMDDSEFGLFIEGKAKLRLVEQQKNRRKPGDDNRLTQAIAELSQKLKEAESRADAESLIASIEYPRRKEFLLGLAGACGVSVGSKDSIAEIERKLIENIVGTKLRSQAIKNVAF